MRYLLLFYGFSLCLGLVTTLPYWAIAEVTVPASAPAQGQPPRQGAPGSRKPFGSPNRPAQDSTTGGTKPTQPPRQGAPSGRKPFGTRGPCEAGDRPFTPLLPLPNPTFSGNTLQERPTLWFYIPYSTQRVRGGQFVVFNAAKKLVYGADLTLPTTPGFVSVTLPSTAPALALNQPYRWELTLYCATETAQPSDDLVRHKGQITRMDRPNWVQKLAEITPEQRVKLYADNQIWYDLPLVIEPLERSAPAWIALLQQLGLDSLRQEAIAGAATVEAETRPQSP
jgi:hypothetical protein